MNKSQAIEAVNSGSSVVLSERDTTGNWYDHKRAWIEDGDLVIAHPTDDNRGPISAPECNNYRVAQ